MVDKRRHSVMNTGRSFLKLPDYESHHAPLNILAQHDKIVIAIAKLDERAHGSLNNINGDSPYYHVAQDIFEALIPIDGVTPNYDNPFITIDWLKNVGVKAAYGWVLENGEIHLDTGTAINGSYSGGIDFNDAKIIVSGTRIINGKSSRHGDSTYTYSWIPEYEKCRFVVTIEGNMENSRWEEPFYWFATGD